jgi:hypothetical protein
MGLLAWFGEVECHRSSPVPNPFRRKPMRITATGAALLLGALAQACTDGSGALAPRATAPVLAQLVQPAPPLVLHVVPPQTTDPAIDQALSPHYVWLDTAARSNQLLLVFMPGTGGVPGSFQLLEQEAARLGYHVIGLMYPDAVNIGLLCTNSPDTGCYEKARLEILDGVDRSDLIDVNAANSIDHRLLKVLELLAAEFPDEDWGRFLTRGAPKWNRIVIGGFSQGGGQAALIAKLRLVHRVVMFSSPNDSVHQQAAPWVAAGATPSDRYFGLAHHRDQGVGPIVASWDSLGMATYGPVVEPESAEPPYGGTHMFVTDVTPRSGSFVQKDVHRSTANDQLTPVDANGIPILLPVWRYMLSAAWGDDDED